jgi:hypothetical protein
MSSSGWIPILINPELLEEIKILNKQVIDTTPANPL